MSTYSYFLFFFFNDTATTEIYTLSLHDALPICRIEETSHVTALIERLVGQCQALEFPHVGLKKLEGPAEKVEPRAVEVQPLRERKGILNGQSHVGHAQLGLYGAVGILHRAVNNALWMDKNLYLIGRNAK